MEGEVDHQFRGRPTAEFMGRAPDLDRAEDRNFNLRCPGHDRERSGVRGHGAARGHH